MWRAQLKRITLRHRSSFCIFSSHFASFPARLVPVMPVVHELDRVRTQIVIPEL